MKNRMLRIAALILTAVLLTGCSAPDFGGFFSALGAAVKGGSLWNTISKNSVVPYSQMEYEHPDMEALQASLEHACTLAEGKNVDEITQAVMEFYDAYDWFYTCASLANIAYSRDLTDAYWQAEDEYCNAQSTEADAMLEALYRSLAKSPARKQLEAPEYFGTGFFNDYDGDSFWDEGLMELMNRESGLMNQYYVLSAEALDYELGSSEYYAACGREMAELLAELIALRQEIAAYLDYPDYLSFANDFSYYRDYSAEQEDAFLEDIRRELVPIYRELNETAFWEQTVKTCRSSQALDYVRQAAQKMGGTVQEAFALLETAELYDIDYSSKKYNTSFEIYLTSYEEPFVFMNPEGTMYDCTTLAHEFGHFCNDYASYGSYAGTDVSEVFSQGMEYLCLHYNPREDVARLKLADSLCTYVEQACYARFEHEMYSLTGEELTADGLNRLYGEIAAEYGMEPAEKWEFTVVPHFYTNPNYIISYVVSNDAAMQFYEMEEAEPGSGLACYQRVMDTRENWFLAFLEEAGLESPFAPGRAEKAAAMFRERITE